MRFGAISMGVGSDVITVGVGSGGVTIAVGVGGIATGVADGSGVVDIGPTRCGCIATTLGSGVISTGLGCGGDVSATGFGDTGNAAITCEGLLVGTLFERNKEEGKIDQGSFARRTIRRGIQRGRQ